MGIGVKKPDKPVRRGSFGLCGIFTIRYEEQARLAPVVVESAPHVGVLTPLYLKRSFDGKMNHAHFDKFRLQTVDS